MNTRDYSRQDVIDIFRNVAKKQYKCRLEGGNRGRGFLDMLYKQFPAFTVMAAKHGLAISSKKRVHYLIDTWDDNKPITSNRFMAKKTGPRCENSFNAQQPHPELRVDTGLNNQIFNIPSFTIQQNKTKKRVISQPNVPSNSIDNNKWSKTADIIETINATVKTTITPFSNDLIIHQTQFSNLPQKPSRIIQQSSQAQKNVINLLSEESQENIENRSNHDQEAPIAFAQSSDQRVLHNNISIPSQQNVFKNTVQTSRPVYETESFSTPYVQKNLTPIMQPPQMQSAVSCISQKSVSRVTLEGPNYSFSPALPQQFPQPTSSSQDINYQTPMTNAYSYTDSYRNFYIEEEDVLGILSDENAFGYISSENTEQNPGYFSSEIESLSQSLPQQFPQPTPSSQDISYQAPITNAYSYTDSYRNSYTEEEDVWDNENAFGYIPSESTEQNLGYFSSETLLQSLPEPMPLSSQAIDYQAPVMNQTKTAPIVLNIPNESNFIQGKNILRNTITLNHPDTIIIDEKPVEWDTFRHRKYTYKDGSEVSLNDKKTAYSENGRVFVHNQVEIFWNRKRKPSNKKKIPGFDRVYNEKTNFSSVSIDTVPLSIPPSTIPKNTATAYARFGLFAEPTLMDPNLATRSIRTSHEESVYSKK